ncbi:MAG: hypothetical protein L6R28_11505 [Planctomycetes bacterium]|nr:hypothetical protein [Planctomycetota bacterium]
MSEAVLELAPLPRKRNPVVSDKLRLFIIVSLLLHFGVAVIYGLPAYMAKVVQEELEEEHKELEKLREEVAEKKAEEVKKEIAKEEVKKDIEEQLKEDFEQIVQDEKTEEQKMELWDMVLQGVTAELEQYANDLMDSSATSEDLAADRSALNQAMVDELLNQLKNMKKEELKQGFIAAVEEKVAGKVADHFKTQIERRIGTPLQREGAKIARDEQTFTQRQKAAINQQLDAAKKQAAAAEKDLAATKAKIEQSEAAAAKEKDPKAAEAKTAQNTKAQAPVADRAGKELEQAQKHVDEAGKLAQVFAGDVDKKVTEPTGQAAKEAQEKAEKAESAAAEGKATEAKQQADEGQKKAQDLAKAIDEAKAAANSGEIDPEKLAKAMMKDVTDKQVKGMLDKSFEENFKENTLPRLGEKVEEAFKKALDSANIEDQKLVEEVGQEVRKMLGDKVPEKADAAKAGTESLEKGEKLAEASEATDAQKSSQRGKEVASKLSNAAKDLTDKEISAMTKDGKGDASLLSDLPAGDEQEGEKKEDLLSRVENLSKNMKDGRMAFMDAAGASEKQAQLRQKALDRRNEATRNMRSKLLFNKEMYEQFTAEIHDRDRGAARGEAWELKGAEGETAAGRDDETAAMATVLVMPPEPEGEVKGEAAENKPYEPEFKTKKFTIARYMQEKPVIDGKLEEWKDVEAMKLHHSWADKSRPGLKIAEPQCVKFAWDNGGLYLCYDIVDADNDIKYVETHRFWEGDGVEIYLDTLNTKDRKRGSDWTQQFWAWPFGEAANPGHIGGEVVSQKGGGHNYLPCGPGKFQRAAQKTKDGWSMEIYLPKDAIRKPDLRAGRIIGFDTCVMTGSPLDYFWCGSNELRPSEHPDSWGDVLLSGSDGKLESPEQFKAERKDGETAKPARAVVVGKPLKISVADADMNLDPKKKDKVSVTVKSAMGDNELVVLEETEAGSGLFEGALATAFALGEPTPEVLNLYEGETVTLVYTDQGRANGARDVEVKLELVSALGAVEVSGQ